jgi:hypothetical protein
MTKDLQRREKKTIDCVESDSAEQAANNVHRAMHIAQEATAHGNAATAQKTGSAMKDEEQAMHKADQALHAAEEATSSGDNVAEQEDGKAIQSEEQAMKEADQAMLSAY